MRLPQACFVLILIVIMLIGCFESSNASIMAEKLSTIPNNSYNMNNTTLDKYPQLKKAIQKPGLIVDLTHDEENRLYSFLFQDSDAKIIRYNNSYFEIHFAT